MSEWWTYSPHDLLMYSARAYYQLFAAQNVRLWPGQGIGLGIVFVFVLVELRRRGGARDLRAASVGLAVCWVFVAWSYFLLAYSTIHTFARGFAGVFLFEAVLLLLAGVGGTGAPLNTGLRARVGGIVLGFALLAQPLVGLAVGRPWRQVELFGVAPDPTVAATFGVLLLSGRSPWWLWVIPIGWTVYNGATLQMLGAPDALMLPAIALTAVATRVATRSAAARMA